MANSSIVDSIRLYTVDERNEETIPAPPSERHKIALESLNEKRGYLFKIHERHHEEIGRLIALIAEQQSKRDDVARRIDEINDTIAVLQESAKSCNT